MHTRTHRLTHPIIAATLFGAMLSLILYAHGAWWWFAPLAVPGLVLAHVAILGGVILVAHVVGSRGSPRRVASRHAGGHPREDESALLHRPKLFDWQVRLMTLGSEGKLRRWIVDLAALDPGDAVLDVGCGTGTLLLTAAERVGPSGVLRGVEPAPEMARRARDKAADRGISLEITEGSADRLPYPSSSFDAAFSTLVLHHLPESMREEAIREMRRVLRRGGRVVIVDWQRPRSLLRAITGGLSLIFLLHSLRPGSSPSDMPRVESLMADIGFEEIERHEYANGVLVALVGRLGSPPGGRRL